MSKAKISTVTAVALVVLFTATSAGAGGPVKPVAQRAGNTAGNTITNGSPTAVSGSSATGVGRVTVTTGVTSTATSGSTSGASSDPYQGQSVSIKEPVQDRYAPTVVAPSLTSGGIGICLGSFSAGLTGPMAGIAFGKTTVDSGCERARDSMILHNMGHKGAALRVLAGESIKDAMAAEGVLPAKVSAIPTMAEVIAAQLGFHEAGGVMVFKPRPGLTAPESAIFAPESSTEVIVPIQGGQ